MQISRIQYICSFIALIAHWLWSCLLLATTRLKWVCLNVPYAQSSTMTLIVLPKVLPCGHTLCAACISKLPRYTTDPMQTVWWCCCALCFHTVVLVVILHFCILGCARVPSWLQGSASATWWFRYQLCANTWWCWEEVACSFITYP